MHARLRTHVGQWTICAGPLTRLKTQGQERRSINVVTVTVIKRGWLCIVARHEGVVVWVHDLASHHHCKPALPHTSAITGAQLLGLKP